MTAQSLPPLAHFTGEGSLVGEESFDRWHEQFEERSVVAGWSEEQKKYQLKMHLDKTAFQACRMMLPKEAVLASGHRRTEGHGIPPDNPRDRIGRGDWN